MLQPQLTAHAVVVLPRVRSDLLHSVVGALERAWCSDAVQTIPHQTHTRALFLVDRVTFHSCALRMAQGMMSLCESSQKSLRHRSCRYKVHFRLHSTCVFFIFHFTDNTSDLSCAIFWNQTRPLCYFARGWTLWPIGWSDPKHRLLAQVLHRR